MSRLRGPSPSDGVRLKGDTSAPANLDLKAPIFCLELVDGFCLRDCTKDEKAALADALFKRSKLSWSELRQAPRHGLGYEKIERSSIKKSIPTLIKEDATFIAFRFCGKAPMVGYKDGRVFHIVWLDRGFALYDHGS